MEFLKYFFVMYIFMLSPGPSMALISRNSAKFGVRGANFTILGIITSITFLTTLAVLGIATVINLYPKAFKTVKLIGSLYIIYLGLKIFFTSFSKHSNNLGSNAKQIPPLKQYLTGISTDLANPMSIVGITSMILGFVSSGDTSLTKFIYSICTILASCCYCYTYAFIFGNNISRKFILPRMSLFERIAGLAITLIGCGFLINTLKLL
jgi:threonine/homoserine/homoserine lactone efflux protein